MATVSLSKGVFAFKNSKLRGDNVNPANKLTCFKECCEDQMGRLRHEHFRKSWHYISYKVASLLEESYSKVFDELVNFIQRKGFQSETSCPKDVPTACLVTGVNMPDHESLYSVLKNSIQNNVTEYIVRLATTDCPNIKSVIQKIVLTFIEGDEVVIYEDSDEEELIETTKSMTKANCNFPVLSTWYKGKYEVLSSPKKKQKNHNSESLNESISNSRPPLVIIIENVEGMPKKVLEDLVCLCSMYRSSLPFILILGVSTTPSAIHSALRQDASACIAMETFQSLPSTELLCSLVENILLKSDVPFRFGGRSFKLLMDNFLFHDLSVKNFINGLKFIMLEHFLSSPGAFLCCSSENRNILIHSLPYTCIELLKKAPSYLKYHSALDEEKMAHLDQAEKFKEFVSDHLNSLDIKYAEFCIMVRVLHCLVYDLPRKPLGKRVREVMERCLIEPVVNSSQFKEALNFLQISSKDELLPKINEVLTTLKEFGQDSLVEFTNRLAQLSIKLNSAGLEVIQTGEAVVSPVRLQLKPTDRFNLREKILEASRKQQSIGKSAFSLVREEVLQFFTSWFTSHLRPPNEYLWHEVMTFDPPISAFRFHLIGGLRAAVITGLSEPYKYLKCSCCKQNSQEINDSSYSDLSICYKLHLECGRHINLFDWMQAFIAIVEGVEDDDEVVEKKGKESIDPKLQARFVQAASELQFLGLIKPTKKKTDHVQRLTWGGC